MNDGRTLRRRSLLYQLEVLDTETGEPLGRVVDVTGAGFLLVGPEAGVPGRLVEATLVLPEPVLGRDRLTLEAQCVWSKPDVNPALQVSGYRIERASAEDREALVGLIVRFHVP